MEPEITERGEIILVGMDFYGDPYTEAGGWSEENAIGKLWSRFENFYQHNRDRIKNLVSEGGYEVWFGTEDEDERIKHIFVGVEVERMEDLPLELVGKMLPATRYAHFVLKGGEIISNWSQGIYDRWLKNSSYEEAHRFLIEYYHPERFKGLEDETSELDIYLPIK